MNTKVKKTKTQPHGKSGKDLYLWVLAIVIIAVAIAADYFYSKEVVWALRLTVWIFVAGIEIAVLAPTNFGRKVWKFARDSRIEMRKVVWPDRQTTIRTTAVVAGLTVLTALILWGVDSIFLWLIGWLTGQRG